jgi:hypothetical protein
MAEPKSIREQLAKTNGLTLVLTPGGRFHIAWVTAIIVANRKRRVLRCPNRNIP